MLLLNSKMLYEFGLEHASARKSMAAWQKTVEEANWKNRQDVLASFPKAKMIRNNRARFEIVHNKYRLIAELFYEERLVMIRFIGTHTEYDRIDPATI